MSHVARMRESGGLWLEMLIRSLRGAEALAIIFEPEAQARASQLSLGFPVTCFMTALRETRNSSSRLDATVWAMNAELTGRFIDD